MDAPRRPRLAWRDAGLLYLGYTAGVLAATWPLVLSPGQLWPAHHDPRLFTWVLASMARRLVSAPEVLFHGNAFYPYGESLALSEPLLIPRLLGLPGFMTGNPVLTYNLLLLLLWPLNGVAMAWVAYQLTGSRPAAWLAGAVFCLSPYFTEYHVEFQMLLAALLPLGLFAWVRWLETERQGWLAIGLGGLALQGLTAWYYAIILGLGLVTLTLGFVCLRWRGWTWRRDLAALAVGAVAVGIVLLPAAVPYLTVHRELGFERTIAETANRSADVLTFFEPGRRSLLYTLDLADHAAETSTFAGFGVLLPASLSVTCLRREARGSIAAARVRRALRVGLVSCLGLVTVLLALRPGKLHLGSLAVSLRPAELLELALAFGFGMLLARGFGRWRSGGSRTLDEGDWVRLLWLLAGVFAVLALGPVIHVGQQAVGPGPYRALYDVLFPLRAIRIATRFGVVYVAAIALLAAFGLKALEGRFHGRSLAWRLVLAGVFAALTLEYAVGPAEYERVTARSIDDALHADPRDGAVLEVPANVADSDADAMFRSLAHGKRVVNGVSGFIPESLRELSGRLTMPATPFPSREAQAALARIYPLHHLVVRLGDPSMTEGWRPAWLALRQAAPPMLRFRGTFGTDDLYDVLPLPERGVRTERWVSYDFLRGHSVLRVELEPRLRTAGIDQWVNVSLNDRLLRHVPLTEATTLAIELPGPYRRAAPNVVALQYGYHRPHPARDADYRIGRTGASSPGDLRVVSVGEPDGSASSIQLDSVELSPDRRGYNLVALDAAGRILAAEAFDTFRAREEGRRLVVWLAALPAGTIVAGAVRDDAAGQLTEDAVGALRTLGVTGDLRKRFREAHAFVGVKGAPPGTAVEAFGPRPVELRIGRVEWVAGDHAGPLGFQLTRFELTRSLEDGPPTGPAQRREPAGQTVRPAAPRP